MVKVRAKQRVVNLKKHNQHLVSEEKVLKMIEHLKNGGVLPLPLIAVYSSFCIPLDGHHRMEAYSRLGITPLCWTITGAQYDRLCTSVDNPEDYIVLDQQNSIEHA